MKKLLGSQKKKSLFWSGVCGLIVGTVVAVFNPGVFPLVAFLTAFLLAAFSYWLIHWVSGWLALNRTARGASVFAFGLRIFIGVLLFLALPVFGYDEAPPNNGYLYLDAYERDMDAWKLASSGKSLTAAFRSEFATDQYGGLLALSAAIYRFLSPDAHRPLLILIITSFFNVFGLPFLWKGVFKRWGEKTANVAAWIYALYPESVILSASQMREPILIGLSAVAFWGVLKWKEDQRLSLVSLVGSVLLMSFISIKAAVAIGLLLIIWFWMENLLPDMTPKARLVSAVLFIAVFGAIIFFSWDWLLGSAKWDLLLTEGASGRIQWEVELIGERFRTPFIIAYGLAQPVLPAAIVYPGLPIMRAIAVYRSLGWYLLAPLLLNALFLVWKTQPKENRRVLLFFIAAVLLWTLISSARAGGDQWDNPRYRAIFLIWMVLVGAWSWTETLKRRSPWLWRLLILEVIYIGFFIHWYLSRYFGLFKRMNFWPMVRLLAIIGALVILGGLLFDLIYNRIRKTNL